MRSPATPPSSITPSSSPFSPCSPFSTSSQSRSTTASQATQLSLSLSTSSTFSSSSAAPSHWLLNSVFTRAADCHTSLPTTSPTAPTTHPSDAVSFRPLTHSCGSASRPGWSALHSAPWALAVAVSTCAVAVSAKVGQSCPRSKQNHVAAKECAMGDNIPKRLSLSLVASRYITHHMLTTGDLHCYDPTRFTTAF